MSKSKEDKSFVSAAMRYTLLSRKGREEGAERKRAQPIIFYFFFEEKDDVQQPAKTSLPLPLFPSVSARLVPKVRQDHAKISHQLRTPGAEQRNCGKPQPPTDALLSASPPPRQGPRAGKRPRPAGKAPGRLDGGWMEPVGVRLAVRRGPRRQGPAHCRVLVSTC